MSYNLDKVLFFRAIDNKDFDLIEKILTKHPQLLYDHSDNIFSLASYCIIKCFECLPFIYEYITNKQWNLTRDFLQIQNIDQSFPLHIAVELQHKEAVAFLLSKSVNPNVQNFQGDTPLNEVTLYSNNLDIAKLLLAYGADPNISNNFNISSLRRAIAMEKLEFVKLFLRHKGNLYGQKSSEDSPIIEDNWIDYILPVAKDDLVFFIQQWIKQQRRKVASISKKDRPKRKQKEMEKYYLRLCEKNKQYPMEKLYQFAQKYKIDPTNKTKDVICQELSTAMLVRRNLLQLE